MIRWRKYCFKRINTPNVYGAATHSGENLRNNYAPRSRSGERWDLLCAASDLNVPRSGSYPDSKVNPGRVDVRPWQGGPFQSRMWPWQEPTSFQRSGHRWRLTLGPTPNSSTGRTTNRIGRTVSRAHQRIFLSVSLGSCAQMSFS